MRNTGEVFLQALRLPYIKEKVSIIFKCVIVSRDSGEVVF